jgi:flagellar hook-length control protein FliK
MARQLGLLRSIQNAGAAADATKATAQVALVQQQVAAAIDALASAEAIAETTTANAAETSVDLAVASAAVTAATLTGGGAGQLNAGVQLASDASVRTVGSTAADESYRGAASGSEVGSRSSLAASLGAGALVNAGLISVVFIPGTPPGDGETLSLAQSTAAAKGAVNSEADGGASAGPDVAQGFAQVARAFDQADALAQTRIARAAAQNRSLAAADGVISAAGTSDATTSAEQVSRSISAAAAAGSLAGTPISGLAFGGEGYGGGDGLSLTGAIGALVGGSGASFTAGLSTGGAGGGGSGNGSGAGFGGRLAASESGSNALRAGGALAPGQSAVHSTFNNALSTGGGVSGLSSAPGIDGGSASFGADAASGAGFSARVGQFAADVGLSGLPGSGVSSAVTPQAIGGSLRVESSGPMTVQGPVTADQLPVALDQTAIDLARLRGGMLTLELAPADLGRLSFEMRIDDSGAAFVAIQLADDTVRALVENAAGSLRDSLSREGFKLDSFTVSSGFSSPEQRENSQNRAFAETSNRRVQSSDSSVGSSNSVQSRASNIQVRPGTRSLSLFA